MNACLNLLCFLFDFLVPRIVTEEVVCNYDENDGLIPVCSLRVVEPGEYYDRICVITSFNIFGFGWGGRMKVPGRPFTPVISRPSD